MNTEEPPVPETAEDAAAPESVDTAENETVPTPETAEKSAPEESAERYFYIGTAAGANSEIVCGTAVSLAGAEIRFTARLYDGLPEKEGALRALSVRVLDADGGAVAFRSDAETNEYVFVMPASDVSILTEVEEVAIDPVTGFADVKQDAYYYESLRWALEQGIVSGTGEHRFFPNAQVTRADVVTMLYRAKGSPEVPTTENPFTDVSEEDEAYLPILWAFHSGIVKGAGEGLFHPERVCSRAEFVTTLWRCEGCWPSTEDGLGFADVKWSDYFCRAVAWSVDYGVANGTSRTAFSPDALCTRANAVCFLYRCENRRAYPDYLQQEGDGWRYPVDDGFAVSNWVIRDGHYYHFNDRGFLDKDSKVAPSLVRIPGYYIHPMKASVYSTREERIEAMISAAYEYLGDRYVVYRSTAPHTAGVDCSGLVMQGLYAAGFDPYPATPEHHSYTEFDSRTLWNEVEMRHVSVDEMERGDLIFYKKNNRATLINHIAIYLGNGYVIEAWPSRVTDKYRVDGYPHTVICGVARPFE